MMQPQNALPHLPHGMTIPQVQISATTEPIMPGQNMLEYGESTMDNQSYQMTQRRSSQDQQMVLMKPPPMFTAQPKLMTSFRSPNARAQRDVHRQESGIDPVGVMSSRLESWRLAVKDLVAVFKKIAEAEENCAKGWVGAGRQINTPFRNSNGQFIKTGGIQDVWSTIRDYSNEHGIVHRQFATYVRDTLIPSLRAVKSDIKKMLNSIQNDKQLKSSEIFENRMKLDKNIAKLEKNIQAVDRSPLAASQATDPFLVNLAVIHAIRGLCDYENRLHDGALALQKEVGVFEQKIIENCRYIMQHLQDFRLEHKMEGIESIGLILEEFDTIEPFTEWNDFIERHQYSLVLENSAYKTEDSVQYPNQHHEYVRASKIGHLATKQGGLSKTWVQGVCVITPSGFLHCYKTPQYFQARATQPTFSIYIADSHIIPGDGREHCFTIKNKLKNNRKSRLSSFNVSTSYTFLAANREESLEWQQALGAIRNEVVPLMTTTLVPMQPQYRNQAPMPDHILPETSSQSVSDFNQAAPSMEFTRERAERPLPQDPIYEEEEEEEEIVPAARQVEIVPMDAAACLDAVQNPSISPYDILSMAKTGMGSYTIPTTDAYADPVLSDHEEEIERAASLQDDTSDEEDVYEASVHEEQVAIPEEDVLSVQEDVLSVQEEEDLPEQEEEDLPEQEEEDLPEQEEEDLPEQEVLSDEELTNEIHQLMSLPLEDDSEDMEYDPATIAQQEANKLGLVLDIQEAPQSQNTMDNEKRVEQSV